MKNVVIDMLNRDPRQMGLLLTQLSSSEKYLAARYIYEHLKYRFENEDQSVLGNPYYMDLLKYTADLLDIKLEGRMKSKKALRG